MTEGVDDMVVMEAEVCGQIDTLREGVSSRQARDFFRTHSLNPVALQRDRERHESALWSAFIPAFSICCRMSSTC